MSEHGCSKAVHGRRPACRTKALAAAVALLAGLLCSALALGASPSSRRDAPDVDARLASAARVRDEAKAQRETPEARATRADSRTKCPAPRGSVQFEC